MDQLIPQTKHTLRLQIVRWNHLITLRQKEQFYKKKTIQNTATTYQYSRLGSDDLSSSDNIK